MYLPYRNYKNIAFSTRFRYQHIALKNHVIFASSNQPVVINHNLNYIPYVMVFTEYPAGVFTNATQNPVAPINVVVGITVNTLELNALSNSVAVSNTKVCYRIYAEPQRS